MWNIYLANHIDQIPLMWFDVDALIMALKTCVSKTKSLGSSDSYYLC